MHDKWIANICSKINAVRFAKGYGKTRNKLMLTAIMASPISRIINKRFSYI